MTRLPAVLLRPPTAALVALALVATGFGLAASPLLAAGAVLGTAVIAGTLAWPVVVAGVMLALGRMHVDRFAAQPQHHYLLRFVDAPDRTPALPTHSLIVDRGPFTVEGDQALMQSHGIELIVCKNAGGPGAAAKLTAARLLGLPIVMIDRPATPDRMELHRPEQVLEWLDHGASPGIERGV